MNTFMDASNLDEIHANYWIKFWYIMHLNFVIKIVMDDLILDEKSLS